MLPSRIAFGGHMVKLAETSGVKLLDFGGILVAVSIEGENDNFALMCAEGAADHEAYEMIKRLADEQDNGEYYLYGAAAMNWYRNTESRKPTYEELSKRAATYDGDMNFLHALLVEPWSSRTQAVGRVVNHSRR